MPIQISWSGEADLKVPIPYDSDNFLIVDDIMDYAIFLQQHELSSFTYVKNEMYHLILYFNYIKSKKISIVSATNGILKSFRNADLNRLTTKSRVAEKKLKRVINSRLTRVYCFYHWYQNHHKLCNLVGPYECAITSDFTLKSKRKNRRMSIILFTHYFIGELDDLANTLLNTLLPQKTSMILRITFAKKRPNTFRSVTVL